MLKCPYCNETIGENFRSCPLCFHKFTDREIMLMREEDTEEQRKIQRELQERVQKFYSRRIIWTIITVAVFLLLWAAYALVEYFVLIELEPVILALTIIYIIVEFIIVFFTDINKCPHCGRILYKNGGSYCKMCGGNIR